MIWIGLMIFIVILAFIGIECTVYTFDTDIVKSKKNLIGVCITSFFGGILFFLIYLMLSGYGFKDGYEEGQINAILGKVDFKLMVKPDST